MQKEDVHNLNLKFLFMIGEIPSELPQLNQVEEILIAQFERVINKAPALRNDAPL
ncbi:28158_t:CDS:2 [Gigaspora margarita]|uniref:28158_t:CDS:1 n=1 Tax=Gigaspora margarita TaxID=4874 RepID=A0ABM8VW12_GIGMA|nr:28158_t:CDS:2 [Gigaspora margarita]